MIALDPGFAQGRPWGAWRGHLSISINTNLPSRTLSTGASGLRL